MHTLTRTDIVRFAGASGDFNPVHHDEMYARALGFPTVFAMGMLTAGMLANRLSDQAGIERVRDLAIRFVAPTWPDEDLSFEIVDEGDPGRGKEAYALVARSSDEEKVTGSAICGQPGETQQLRPSSGGALKDERQLGSFSFPVERGKIAEFARATHTQDPLFFDPGLARTVGFDDVVAPLTFSATTGHWTGGDASLLMADLDLDISRTVHGGHRWSYVRPVVAGDVLTGTRRLTAAYEKPARTGGVNKFVHVATDYVDAAGAAALFEELVVIERPKMRK